MDINTPYKTPYDEGYRDGEEMGQKRIAELEAKLQKWELGASNKKESNKWYDLLEATLLREGK